MEGNIETDFIKISVWNAVAENACEYLDKGDIIGVKGRLVVKDTEVSFIKGDEVFKKKIPSIEIIGERVVYIHTYNRKSIKLAPYFFKPTYKARQLWNSIFFNSC